MNVYVPCRVSARDQGELVVNVLHVLGQRIVDSVTSARYCVTKQNLLQDEASPWESFIWIQWNILALYFLLVCSKVWEKKKLVFKENWVSSCMTERLNGLLTDWLNDWMTEWLNDWMTEWLTDWLTEWLTDWLAEWLTDWLTEWVIVRRTPQKTCRPTVGQQLTNRLPTLYWQLTNRLLTG